MTVPATIRLIADVGTYEVMLGTGDPTPSGGFVNIEEVARNDNVALSSWNGAPLLKLEVPVLFDGFVDGTDQQPAVDAVAGLAVAADTPPSPIVAAGPIPYPNRTWLMAAPTWGRATRDADGVLVRQEMTLNLVEFVDPDTIHFADQGGAPSASTAAGGKKSKARTYTVKQGDTLLTIAAKTLGKSDRWSEIARYNGGIRDPRKQLKPGRVLRLPPRNTGGIATVSI